MTDQEIIDYYANLLIIQYKGKPRALAHIKFLASVGIIDQLPMIVQNAYNVDNAIGVQLDVIGKYAGVVRTYGSITLGDDDFRTLIRIAIIKNSANSDLYSIQKLIYDFFPGTIYVFDYKGMRMSFYLDTSLGSADFAQLVVSQGLLPLPMGVTLSSTIYGPNVGHFFGFSSYENPAHNASPFSTYERYQANLLPISEEFAGGTWLKTNAYLQDNVAVAANGASTASSFDDAIKFVPSEYSMMKGIAKAASALTYTGSIFVKKALGRYVKFVVDAGSGLETDNVTVYFDITNKESSLVENNGTFSGGIFSYREYDNGWIQISLSCLTGIETAIRIRLFLATSLSSYLYIGTNSTQIYIWGAMIRLGLANEYVPNPLYISAPSTYWLTYPDTWLDYSYAIT
jgi:hypothetical protein